MQNGFVESFNGRLRDECLNKHLFANLTEARDIIEEWRNDYNTNRPHSSLNGLTPTEFAARPKEGQNLTCFRFSGPRIAGKFQFSGTGDSGRWTGKDHETIEVF